MHTRPEIAQNNEGGILNKCCRFTYFEIELLIWRKKKH